MITNSNRDDYDSKLYNSHVFETELPRVPQARLWKLEKSRDAVDLQRLFDKATENKEDPILCKNYIDKYQEKLEKLQSEGNRNFTLTKGKVFELVDDPEQKTMNVPIKIQVKEGVLTWYFCAPMDQTKQSFRDEIFLSAGLAQVGVDDSCFRYLRGTNSLHVKKMHTDESESLFNHNHYVLEKGYDYTPERFKQHLDGFVKAERELFSAGFLEGETPEKFLTQEEADAIVKAYTQHWEKINQRADEPDETEAQKHAKKSLLEEKKELGQKRLTREDKHEWVKYSQLVHSVISSGFEKVGEEVVPVADKNKRRESETYIRKNDHFTINPDWELPKRIEAVKDAMRGGFSNRAQVRQMTNSPLPALPEITQMNDEVKIKK